MIVQETQPSLAVMLARRKMAPLWKKGMADLHARRIAHKIRVDSEFEREFMWSVAHASFVDAGPSKDVTDRGYGHHNARFKPFVKQDILEILLDMAQRHKNRPLRILDDGAGHGNFLAYVKEHLTRKGIRTETTALSLTLFEELEKQNIDRVRVGSSESFVPDKKQDLIISFMGTVLYLPQSICKEVILKHAYSLEKGGILMLATPLFPFKAQEEAKMFRRLSDSLEKRGFRVIHAGNVEDWIGILIIQRIK